MSLRTPTVWRALGAIAVSLLASACAPVVVPLQLDVPLVLIPDETDASFFMGTGEQNLDAIRDQLPAEVTTDLTAELTGLRLEGADGAPIGPSLSDVRLLFSADGEPSGDDQLLAEFRNIPGIAPHLSTEARESLDGSFALFIEGVAKSPEAPFTVLLTLDLAVTLPPSAGTFLTDQLPGGF